MNSTMMETVDFPDGAGMVSPIGLSVVVYRGAVDVAGPDPAAAFEDLFEANGWPPAWRNGVHPYHHCHPEAHEALGFAAGQARILLGGDGGVEVTVRAGDIAVLPAGTGHCLLSADPGFLVVGAYPPGQNARTSRQPGSTAEADLAPVPDPVAGPDAGLAVAWSQD